MRHPAREVPLAGAWTRGAGPAGLIDADSSADGGVLVMTDQVSGASGAGLPAQLPVVRLAAAGFLAHYEGAPPRAYDLACGPASPGVPGTASTLWPVPGRWS